MIHDTIRQLYPEDRYVTPDTIIGWAFDLMIDDAFAEAYSAGLNVEHEELVRNTPRPALEHAIAFLEDLGKCTFERADITHRVVCEVNSLSDVMRPLARACWPKIQHATRAAAIEQLRTLVQRNLAKDESRIHTYICPHCTMPNGAPAFHVGHGA